MRKKGIILLLYLMMVVILCPVQTQAAAKTKLNKTKISMYIGDSVKLKVSGTTKKITWSSSNVNAASVSSSGKVTGKSVGQAIIKAKAGEKTYNCTVNVKNALSVNKTSLTKQDISLKMNFIMFQILLSFLTVCTPK